MPAVVRPCAVLIAALLAGPAAAQAPPADAPPAALAGVVPPPDAGPPPGAVPPRPPRNPFGGPPGEVEFWTAGPGSDFSVSQLSLGYLVPVGKAGDWAFSVKPQAQFAFFGGPEPPGPEVPSRAYALGVDLRADWQVNPRLRVQAAVAPGLYTDFENVSGEAFRFPARLLAMYFHSPQWVFVGGVVVTAQPDLPILPAVGAIWSPSECWRVELLLPRPRVVYRWSDDLEVYGAGSIVTATYAVRAAGVDDLLQYRDFRLGGGAEWTAPSGLRLLGEVGVSLGRDLDFDVQPGASFDPGVYLRAGGRF